MPPNKSLTTSTPSFDSLLRCSQRIKNRYWEPPKVVIPSKLLTNQSPDIIVEDDSSFNAQESGGEEVENKGNEETPESEVDESLNLESPTRLLHQCKQGTPVWDETPERG